MTTVLPYGGHFWHEDDSGLWWLGKNSASREYDNYFPAHGVYLVPYGRVSCVFVLFLDVTLWLRMIASPFRGNRASVGVRFVEPNLLFKF